MTGFIILLAIVLVVVISVQIGKIVELANKIRGQEESDRINADRTAFWLLVFGIALILGTIWSCYHYKNFMLGYGPHEAASIHGKKVDSIFNLTVILTGIVFVLTQVALFYFAFKYKGRPGKKVLFIPHNNKLEFYWTITPAIVMTILVVSGLMAWNEIMADVKEDEDFIEIEAVAYQFAWDIRYPGKDHKLGTRNYKLISGTNGLGMDWTDPKTHDDFIADQIVLPKGKKVRVRITSKDVLHNFYLPQFRVKMDAIPGLPTYFVFTPEKTLDEYKLELRKYPEYLEPSDPKDPFGPKKWETFTYELGCAELCGIGHYSMRKVVKIVSPKEYEEWFNKQNSVYFSTVRNTDDDPNKGKVLAGEPITTSVETKEKVDTTVIISKESLNKK
ncbi:MAG: cytochrome c oxidase subunit II [Saprospiraceae bacterium]|mgnify:CR=1 FL=1|nr:cytochrome c oxidase subunit II [Saprospiraceae bacterium]